MSTELEAYKKALARERAARKAAEKILEEKSMELFAKNQELEELNRSLEQQVQDRTRVLEESEAKYRSLIESANDIIYGSDQDGHFEFVNAVAERILGYTAEECVGRHFSDLVLESHREATVAFYQQQFLQREPTSYYEFPVLSKDGSTVWLGQNVRARINSNNHVIGFRAVARDITAQKRAEAKLRQSEEKYRSIIENLRFGMMEVNLEGNVTRVYEGMYRMTGYTEEELIGKNPNDVFLSEEWRDFMKKQLAKRKAGESHVYEVQLRRKDGSMVWAMISGTPLYDEMGEVCGSIGIHLDLTDRKRIEDQLRIAQHRAEESSRAKQAFLANMSHEIRTPMNGIKGMLHLLSQTLLQPEQQRYLRNMTDSSNHLMVLINDILDLSKIEAGKLDLESVPVSLPQLLENVEATFSQRTEDKGIDLSIQIDPAIEQNVLADPTRLRQIVDNLINNAIKFTDRGGISIALTCEGKTATAYTVRLSVADTGIGIEMERVEEVFESFSQENDSTSRLYGGTGLGLPICKQLVELMGGQIFIRSEKGTGTEVAFELTMPITTEQPAQAPSVDTNVTEQLSGLRVLLAEDHDINRFLATKLLEDAGIEVFHAENGQEAIELFKTQPVELILMDMQMPVLDGLDATRFIRKSMSKEVPIIALTANAIKGDEQRCLDAGMNDYVSKPFEPAVLFGKMARLIGNQQPEQSKDSQDKSSEGVAEESEQDAGPLYDLTAIYELANGDDAFVKRMVEMFVQRTPATVDKMQAAAETGDFTTAGKLAHQLKPSIDTLKIIGAKELVREIEKAGKSGGAGLAEMLERLVEVLGPVLVGLRAEV